MNVQPSGAQASFSWEESLPRSPQLCWDVGVDTSTSPGLRGHPCSLNGRGETLAKKSDVSEGI